MRILGLSAFGGPAAAALVHDGRPVAAMREERFTGLRDDATFPRRALRACLRSAGIDERGLDLAIFHEKPLRRFERVLISHLRAFPRAAGDFAGDLSTWLGERLWLAGQLEQDLGLAPGKVLFCERHVALASSALYASPFDEAAILVIDGEGEWATTTLARGNERGIEILAEQRHPHSYVLLQRAVADYLGFEARPGEPRLAALAAWGEPRFLRELESVAAVSADGVLRLADDLFRVRASARSGSGPALVRALGEARAPGSALRYRGADRRDADLAASLQALLERSVLALACALERRTGLADVCLAGDLAFNCGVLARLARDGPFERLFVPPDPGAAGAALGAALYAARVVEGAARWRMTDARLGEPLQCAPAPDARRIAAAEIPGEIATRLEAGRVVAWVRGPFEWGPRALGQRSLLVDARQQPAVERLRRLVKPREAWLSFACAVAEERAAEFIDLPPRALPLAAWLLAQGQARPGLAQQVPALVAADGSVRPQLVSARSDAQFHALLAAFEARSGFALLLHTSLNQRGHPPVRGEAEALALLRRGGIDDLLVEDRLYSAP